MISSATRSGLAVAVTEHPRCESSIEVTLRKWRSPEITSTRSGWSRATSAPLSSEAGQMMDSEAPGGGVLGLTGSTGLRSRSSSLWPTSTPRRAHSPAESSSTARARRLEATRHGPIRSTISSTRKLRSRNRASIGKRMNAVWIAGAGCSNKPSPAARPRRPIKPRIRSTGLSASSLTQTQLPLVRLTMSLVSAMGGGVLFLSRVLRA